MRKKTQFKYGIYHDSLRECVERFGTIFDLPVIGSPSYEMISRYKSGNVLDIGAGKLKPFYKEIKNKLKKGKYYSLDNDPQGKFDFRSINSVPARLKFSLIIANQVFEHLDIEESMKLMRKAALHLTKGGHIISTVPNIAHPNRQRSNITHKTAWGYNSFYMVFKTSGLEVINICRYSRVEPRGLIEKILAKRISRLYRMDWCDSILLVGRKNA